MIPSSPKIFALMYAAIKTPNDAKSVYPKVTGPMPAPPMV